MLSFPYMARKNPAAVKLGKLGGKARAANLSPEELSEIGRKGGEVGGKRRAEALTEKQRKEIARKAAAKRWAGHEAKRPATKRASKPKSDR
jgi:general stress protein YciG